MNRYTSTVILVIAIVYILIVAKNYLIPFSLALFIWFLIKNIKDFIRKSSFIRKRLPEAIQNLLVFIIIFGFLAIITQLLGSSIESFTKVIPTYEANIRKLNDLIMTQYNIDVNTYLKEQSGNINFGEFAQPILNNISSIFSNSFMIILYVVFLLLEESTFMVKKNLLFKDPDQLKQTNEILSKIDHSFGSYLSLKTLTSIMTAVLSYFVLLILGVDSPVLWSIIIFLFNYIPSIGSLIATAFPVIIVVLQTGELLPGLWVLIGVGAVQMIIGNVVEPRLMGNSLNISPLVVIISLIAWGAIWGVVGMVLSVPIMVMLIIVFSQFESTQNVAILLSENGKIKDIQQTGPHKSPMAPPRSRTGSQP